MEVGFGRGVGRKGNGMMRERMKTEEKMRWNTMTLEFESRPCNESFARVSAAAFLAQLNPTVEEVADVKTAISEAVTNAMIHGYRQEKGKIQMKCVLDLEEKVFQVTVKDTGVGIENVEKAMDNLWFIGDVRPEISVETVVVNEIEVDVLTVYDTQKTPIYLKRNYGEMLAGCIYMRQGKDR